MNLDAIPVFIREKIGKNLHQKFAHPLEQLKFQIQQLFEGFHLFDKNNPYVTVEENFDDLLIPQNCNSRHPDQVFYLDNKHVLRTHTSAHQIEILKMGYKKFLIAGDVYVKDTIERSRYPVMHQIEGVCVYPDANNIDRRLHIKMEALFDNLGVEYRKCASYYQYANPSWEYEVKWEGKWIEVAGCGIIRPEILNKIQGVGYSFGINLDRLAMARWGIPDIRLFWSEDDRFLNQFKKISKGLKYKDSDMKAPHIKSLSMYDMTDPLMLNDLFLMIRETSGDLVESITKPDDFTVSSGKRSVSLKVSYRSPMDKVLYMDEVEDIHSKIQEKIKKLNIRVR